MNYTLQILDPIPGHKRTEAHQINNRGEIVGWSAGEVSQPQGVLWQNGSALLLDTEEHPSSIPNRINDLGIIIGGTSFYPFDRQVGTVGARAVPFTWTNGTTRYYHDLPQDNIKYRELFVDNNSSKIVGRKILVGVPGMPYYHCRSFVLEDGTRTELTPPSEIREFLVCAINELNEIVGIATLDDSTKHIARCDNGSWSRLGALGYCGLINDINDAGNIVGAIHSKGTQAFYWCDGSIINLGSIDFIRRSEAFGINSSNQVVGYTYNFDYRRNCNVDERAFLWQNNEMYDLDDLIESRGSGWIIEQARSINDNGQIVGVGSYYREDSHAILLNPA